jgi:hypothetical protein
MRLKAIRLDIAAGWDWRSGRRRASFSPNLQWQRKHQNALANLARKASLGLR